MMEEEIRVEIKSMHEIPSAYQVALKILQEKESYADIWDGQIELTRVLFQDNFRRTEYICVFKVKVMA